MVKVRCRHCKLVKDGFCSAKKTGGKHPKVKLNKKRECKKFSIDPISLAADADKDFYKSKIPRFVPTWRYWATEKELEEANEKDGAKFVKVN